MDLLLQLKATIPGVLLNSERSIELFRPCYQKTVAMNCIYKSSAISFDVRLKVKKPCTFEGNADCSLCGCPMVMIHEAKMGGDRESVNLLHALFPKRNSYNIETFVQHGISQQWEYASNWNCKSRNLIEKEINDFNCYQSYHVENALVKWIKRDFPYLLAR